MGDAEGLAIVRPISYNVLLYAASVVPNKPVISVEQFPELKPLSQNWDTIRNEAVRLFDEGFIRAAAKNNDEGFYSSFKMAGRTG